MHVVTRPMGLAFWALVASCGSGTPAPTRGVSLDLEIDESTPGVAIDGSEIALSLVLETEPGPPPGALVRFSLYATAPRPEVPRQPSCEVQWDVPGAQLEVISSDPPRYRIALRGTSEYPCPVARPPDSHLVERIAWIGQHGGGVLEARRILIPANVGGDGQPHVRDEAFGDELARAGGAMPPEPPPDPSVELAAIAALLPPPGIAPVVSCPSGLPMASLYVRDTQLEALARCVPTVPTELRGSDLVGGFRPPDALTDLLGRCAGGPAAPVRPWPGVREASLVVIRGLEWTLPEVIETRRTDHGTEGTFSPGLVRGEAFVIDRRSAAVVCSTRWEATSSDELEARYVDLRGNLRTMARAAVRRSLDDVGAPLPTRESGAW